MEIRRGASWVGTLTRAVKALSRRKGVALQLQSFVTADGDGGPIAATCHIRLPRRS
jgi:hypothetical protein